MKNLNKLILSVMMTLITSFLIDALTVEKASLEELTTEANLIIEGKIKSSYSIWENKNIYTYTTLGIQDELKGNAGSQQIVVKQLGGTVGDITQSIEGTPHLEINDEVVLFLVRWKDSYWIHSIVLGYYSIVKTGGVKYAVNDFNGVEVIDPNTGAPVVNHKEIQGQYKLSSLYFEVKKILEKERIE